jgi:hypothetical protein
MLSSQSSRCTGRALLLSGLLCCSSGTFAQGVANPASPTMSTQPYGVDEKDTLKDFHHALAVQATSEQVAEFHGLLTTTDLAKSEVQRLLHSSSRASNSELDQALEAARNQTRKFTEGFSEKQQSGLKEQLRLLDRDDAVLTDEQKKVDQALQIPAIPAPELANAAAGLDRALGDFSSQQLSLAREMGIVLAKAEDVTFNLPAVKTTVHVANQPLQVTVSSMLSQTAADAGQRIFRLQMMGDLSNFQQNITEVLQVAVNNQNRCGERLTVRRAMLMPSPPVANLHLQLHYERWACLGIAGQSTSTEIAEDNGDAEIRLIPTVSESGVQLETAFGRIDATGMMGDSLRSGDLGHDLRERVAQTFLAAMRTTTDLKASLPPVLQSSSTVQSGKFEDDGAGDLSITLLGEAKISAEQAKSLANQLNQTFSAEGNRTK